MGISFTGRSCDTEFRKDCSEFFTMSGLADAGPIGVFDSGYGGLTILRQIKSRLPQYDYLYLGDNARAPYGTRSFDIVYKFTLQAVEYLFSQGCKLVILACNTASAKALRTIQQHDLQRIDPTCRVLGVIRPTVEKIGSVTHTCNIGILGTPGTIQSKSYDLEIAKMYDGEIRTYGQECPMWVPLVECMESDGDGADYFVQKYINELMCQCNTIDSVILGCTHYPLLLNKIEKYIPAGVTVVEQGAIVAESLANYLTRHPEMDIRCSKSGVVSYMTTENVDKFKGMASMFLGEDINVSHVEF